MGDFINKGPYSLKTLRYIKSQNILAIRGNHEDKFIRYSIHDNIEKRYGRKNPMKLNSLEKEIYESFTSDDIDFLNSLPIFLRFGRLTVVHAGITNRIFLKKASKKDFAKIMRIRFVDEYGNFVPLDRVKDDGCCYWSEIYDGHEGFILFGHQPFLYPKIDRFSIGIDTGCVYGNRLTAAIFDCVDEKAIIPSYRFVSIKAKKAYAKREKPWLI